MERGYIEMLSAHMVKVTILTSLTAISVFALVGPLGSYSAADPLRRWAVGALCAVEGWLIHHSLLVVTLYYLRRRTPVEALAGLVTAALIVAVPNTAWVLFVERVVVSVLPTDVGFLEMYLMVAPSTVSCTVLYFYVLWQRIKHGRSTTDAGRGRAVLAEAADTPLETTDAVECSTEQRRADVSDGVAFDGASAENQAEPANSPAQPADDQMATERPTSPHEHASCRPDGRVGTVLKLLPDRVGTDLVYIKSEDHYLEVNTTLGSSLIKMRFSDAVAELGDSGMQVHRSYWVATRHVNRSIRSGKRTLLRLTGDHKVPVSVPYLPAVRAALGC